MQPAKLGPGRPPSLDKPQNPTGSACPLDQASYPVWGASTELTVGKVNPKSALPLVLQEQSSYTLQRGCFKPEELGAVKSINPLEIHSPGLAWDTVGGGISVDGSCQHTVEESVSTAQGL